METHITSYTSLLSLLQLSVKGQPNTEYLMVAQFFQLMSKQQLGGDCGWGNEGKWDGFNCDRACARVPSL